MLMNLSDSSSPIESVSYLASNHRLQATHKKRIAFLVLSGCGCGAFVRA
jgi:hypothetical protein